MRLALLLGGVLLVAFSAMGVVITSAKKSIFIAGADLTQLAKARSAAELRDMIELGQVVFNHLTQLPVPVVAAIHGACVGGVQISDEHVPREQHIACPHTRGPRRWMRQPGTRRLVGQQAGGEPFSEPLEPAAAQLGEPPPRGGGRHAVVEDGNPHLTDPAADPMSRHHSVFHARVRERNEGQHVQGADARMDTFVAPQIDVL